MSCLYVLLDFPPEIICKKQSMLIIHPDLAAFLCIFDFLIQYILYIISPPLTFLFHIYPSVIYQSIYLLSIYMPIYLPPLSLSLPSTVSS